MFIVEFVDEVVFDSSLHAPQLDGIVSRAANQELTVGGELDTCDGVVVEECDVSRE